MARRKKGKRRNPTMPVVLVNPASKRKNPGGRRRKRRGGRRLKRRRNPALARRRNPKTNWKGSAVGAAIGLFSGAISYAGRWGASYLPWKDWQQTATFSAGALVSSLVGARYIDERMGVGIAGGAGALIAQDVKNIIEVRRLTDGAPANGADAVYRLTGRSARQASAVYAAREAGALVRQTSAPTMQGNVLAPRGQSFKTDVGASRFVGGPPLRMFGPNSWATRDTGRRYVSAHTR